MPFSGGGGGALQNHVHNNVPLQGGPLDFSNNTIAGMAQGDITYSDGNALQILNAPAVPNNEVLTFAPAAVAPSWAAAGGATVELLDNQTISGTASPQLVTFTPAGALTFSDYSYLVCVLNSSETATGTNQLQMRINNLVANYDLNAITVTGGAASYNNTSGAASWTIKNFPTTTSWQLMVWMQLPNYASATESTINFQYSDTATWRSGSGYIDGLPAAEINDIEFEFQGGASNRNIRFQCYGVTV